MADGFVIEPVELAPEYQVVGGILDSLLKGLIGSMKPDFTKINHELLKDGLGRSVDAFRPTVSGPLVGMIFDGVKLTIDKIIDAWKQTPVLVVGAVGDDGLPRTTVQISEAMTEAVSSRARLRNKDEVAKLIESEGGDPKQFAPWLLLLLQYLPLAIELIRKLLNK